jgi:hypothetical protein
MLMRAVCTVQTFGWEEALGLLECSGQVAAGQPHVAGTLHPAPNNTLNLLVQNLLDHGLTVLLHSEKV